MPLSRLFKTKEGNMDYGLCSIKRTGTSQIKLLSMKMETCLQYNRENGSISQMQFLTVVSASTFMWRYVYGSRKCLVIMIIHRYY